MASETKLVRIQDKGQVTLPAAVRKRLGLKKGDLVAVVATPDGVLITPQEVVASKALDQIGAILKEQGLSLEDLIDAGRDGRDELVREQYGVEPAAQPD
jgi:AbrB family looped-hinge helix DNA binding protein